MGRYDIATNRVPADITVYPKANSGLTINSEGFVTASLEGPTEGEGPKSIFLIISGPSGYRLFIPLRKLQYSYKSGKFTIDVPYNAGNSLVTDIEKAKESNK